MAYDIGPKIGIDGESEFRKSIKQVSENIRTLGSEMKVVTSAFADNADSMEALTAKNEVLRKQADAVADKIKLQADMAAAASERYGEASVEAQKWQRALNESKAELNKLNNEIKANERSMDGLGDETEDVEKNLKDAGKAGLSFGDVLKANVLSDAITSGIRALGNAVADVARAFVDFAKSGVETASDLEEVQNVVDTTFGDKGAGTIEAWAKSAAGAFGMSELSAKQFTGTMGAMLKSMGLSEDAVLEMSTDIAGLAGDMASFYNLDPEEAFAKLRSGISGETEPLKQLGINMSVANLEAYALAQGITKAYKDMTQAEQATLRYNYLMQATADAQGDFARTSDSYANQQRILQLNMENLGASIGTKVLPYLTGFSSALNGLLSGQTDVSQFVASISDMVLQAAQGIIQGLPAMAEAAGSILSALISGIRTLLPELAPVAIEVIFTLVNGLLEQLPAIAETAALLLSSIALGIADHLPELIPTIVSVVMQIVEALTDPDTLVALIDAALQLILALSEGLIKAIPELIDAIPVIIENLIASIIAAVPMLLAAGVELIVQLAAGLITGIPKLIASIPKIILAIVDGLVGGIAKIYDVGKNIVSGLWEGIKSMWSWLKEKVGGIFSGLVNGVKDLLGIHSPSRVFAGIGGYMAEGLGVGFDKEIGAVQRDINRSMADLAPNVSGSVSFSGRSSVPGASAGFSAADLRSALSGMGIYMSGQRVGELTTVAQRNNARAMGTA